MIRILTILAILFSPLIAGAAEPEPAPGGAVVHIGASEELVDLGLGLNLILSDEVVRRGGWVIDRDTVDKKLKVAGVEQSNNAICVKDIPYIASSTNASHVIQGWLEETPDGLRLDLRQYDIYSGNNLNSVRLYVSGKDLSALKYKCVPHLVSWLKLPVSDAALEDWITPGFVKLIVELWKEEKSWPEELQMKLIRELSAPPGIGPQLSPWLTGRLAGRMEPVKDAKDLIKAVQEDLSGRLEDALATYASIRGKSPASCVALLRRIALLNQAGRTEDARRLIYEGARLWKNEPIIVEWTAWFKQLEGQPKQVYLYLNKLESKVSHPGLWVTMARKWQAEGMTSEALQAYGNAVPRLWEDGLMEVATRIVSEETDLSAKAVMPRYLAANALDENQRGKLFSVIMKLPASRETILARARLLAAGAKPLTAGYFYDWAVMKGEYDADIFSEAGNYFIAQGNTSSKVELYLKVALKLKPECSAAMKALSDVLQRRGRCEDGKKLISDWAAVNNEKPFTTRSVAEYSLDCGDLNGSERMIMERLARHPDDADTLLLLTRLLMRKGNKIEAQVSYARLKAVDARMAEEAGLPEENEIEVKLQAPEQGGDPMEATEAVGGSESAKYDELANLQEQLNKSLQQSKIKIDIGDLAELVSNTPPGELDKITKSLGIKANTGLASQQLQRLMLENKDAKSLLQGKKASGIMDMLKTLASQAESSKEDLSDRDGKSAEKTESNRNIAAWLLDFSESPVLKTGILLVIVLILLFLSALLLYGYRRLRGHASLNVRIHYNRSLHKEYFIGRMTTKETQSAFGDVIGSSKYYIFFNQTLLGRFWRTLFPYKAVATTAIMRFSSIPEGEYHIYIAGIQIDPKSQLPIGSVEIHEKVNVTGAGTEAIVRFDEDLAFIGVRVVNLFHLAKSSDGLTTNSTDKVTLTLNGDKNQVIQGRLNEEIVLHLPPGEHCIVAVNDHYCMEKRFHVSSDLKSQWFEFYLEDKVAGLKAPEKPIAQIDR